MGEINHFTHEQHPLKLIENWETVVGVVDDDNVEKKGVVHCDGCREPISISGGSAYGCIKCGYFMHKTCAELIPSIVHPSHPLHPLKLTFRDGGYYCDVCGIQRQCLIRGWDYKCVGCDFDACTKCISVAVAQEVAAVALRKEASVKVKYEGHPQHTLTLQLRPGSFHCDACHTKDEDFFYQCNDCDFWIHKGCTSLATTINLLHHPNHPLVLVYSLSENFYNFPYYCEFCNKRVLQNDWLYHCANCRYFSHIKCALNAEPPSTPRDGPSTSVDDEHVKDLLQFPMSYSFTDPLRQLHFEKVSLDDDDKTNEINHWSHDHPLILNIEEPQHNIMPYINSSDLIEVCRGCVRPLSFPYYSCKDGCSFTIHKYCAQLPPTLQHQLHSPHSLKLVDKHGDEYFYRCNGCYSWGNTFAYKCESCNFYLCVNCAFLPNTIKHKSHNHLLIQLIDSKLIDPKLVCKACNYHIKYLSYACKGCDFNLCIYCAIRSPSSLGHRYCKGHEIPLVYPPVDNHPEDFYCDICEKEMHPKRPLYYCHKCKNSFHLYCISRIDGYANVFYSQKTTVWYHKHPLTFVRRQKNSPKFVCSTCNGDINGLLILECRSKVCNFNICYYCHRKKEW